MSRCTNANCDAGRRYLPVGNIKQQLTLPASPYTGPTLQGEYRIVTPLHADGPDHEQRQRRSSTIP